MRRIVDAADGRDLTRSQLADFRGAVHSFKSLVKT